jgi:hypothetical protein
MDFGSQLKKLKLFETLIWLIYRQVEAFVDITSVAAKSCKLGLSLFMSTATAGEKE